MALKQPPSMQVRIYRQNRIMIMSHKKKIKAFNFIKNKINLFSSNTASIPVFVFGSQRSGTTMLMNVFELNSNFLVYHESNKKAFDENYRIINFDKLGEVIDSSNFEFVAFKPISDSHLINLFSEKFPDSKKIWLYRNYRDVANSSVVKWNAGERNSIREIGKGIIIDDWFTEGLSDNTIKTIRTVYRDDSSLHECAALWWWARNRIVMEKEINTHKNVLLVNYDDLVKNPVNELSCISDFLGARRPVSAKNYIHGRSICKQEFPEIDARVKELCEQLSVELAERTLENKKNLQKV